MTIPPHTLTLLRLAAMLVVFLTVVIAAVASPTTHAQQVDDSLPPLADLTIASSIPGLHADGWEVTVKNNTVGAHPGTQVHLVKVRITRWDPVRGTSMDETWTIRNLPPGGSAVRRVDTLRNSPRATDDPRWVPQRLYAEIIESDPVELPRFRFNTATENWVIEDRQQGYPAAGKTYFAIGDVAADVASISDRLPQAGGATTFTVAVLNNPDSLPNPDILTSEQSKWVFDVQVEISLSPGLSFAANQPEPPSNLAASTSFDTDTGIWDVGATDGSGDLSLPVAVNLTADSLADLSLGERCLTAKVVRAVPWDPLRRQNDTVTACLGNPTLEGEFILFYPYDCVGNTAHPCTDTDTVEILARLISSSNTHTWLQPESFVVYVSDPIGRVNDSHSGSVTDFGIPSWQTARDHPGGAHQVKGIKTGYTRAGFNDQIADWSNIVRTVTVSGLNGAAAPGRVKIRFNTASGNVFFDPNPVHRRTPFSLNSPSTVISNYFLEFSALGTYVVEFKVDAVRSDTSMTTYIGSGTYTFHVGPLTDLEVRDAGPSPAVGADRRAYTVMAVNNGPTAAAHAVEVTLAGVPEDAEAVASHGSYDPASGVWTIGRLKAADQRAYGFAEEGPTLTLSAAASAPITATIENTQDYCVRIKTIDIDLANDLECAGDLPTGYTEHSSNYYDHIPGNNQAEIIPWPGVGDGHPDAPASLTAVDTPAGNILQWEPVERVNRHPVTHYEIQKLLGRDWRRVADGVPGTIHLDEDYASGMPQYRVRAVNWMGVGGPWSKPTAAQEGESVQADDPAQPPDPTTGLSADPGDGYVDLKWRAHRSDGREIFWQLWRSDQQTWWDVFPRNMGSSRLGYTVTELENGREYIFRVRAATPNEYGDLVPGVSSGPVLATPTAPSADRPPGRPDAPSGPNTPPEFDRATAWADYCVNAGARSGTEVARVGAYDQDGDRLTFYQVNGFDEIADNHFTVSTVRSGEAYWGVIRVSRTLPRNLEPDDGFILIDLELNDGRGGLDQIGVTLQYDPNGRNCAETASAAIGEIGPSALAALMSGVDILRGRWTGFSRVFAGLALPTPVALYR